MSNNKFRKRPDYNEETLTAPNVQYSTTNQSERFQKLNDLAAKLSFIVVIRCDNKTAIINLKIRTDH